MEEKKLTDEEIVKALDCLSGVQLRDCNNCSFMDGNFCDDFAIARNAIDLIHRLQDDNKNYDRANSELTCTIAEQKAEIERLTKEHKKDTMLLYASGLACEQVKAENKHLDKLLGEKRMDELNKAKEIVAQNCILNEENAELQKQVDELKKQFLSTCENCHLKKDIELLRYQKEQAVKDTAKEILIPLIDCEKQIDPLKTGIRWSVLKGFCKKFDVEVE